MKKNSSKTPKKNCGDLKAKVRELRKEARKALDKKEKANKKYKRKLDKLVKELEPYKTAVIEGKAVFKKKKKKYLKAKAALNECLSPKPKTKKKKTATKKKVATPVVVEAKPIVKKVPPVKPIVAKSKPVAEKKEAVKTTPKPKKTVATPPKPAISAKDNLKKIEGIGPKIESLLNADGIKTFAQLSKANVERLRKVLTDAGPRFRMHSPDTWAEQAGIANSGDWDKLKELQDVLKGGRR